MRGARRRRWATALLAAAVLTAALAADDEERKRSRFRYSDAPTPEWREGPVRYIITKSEDDEYRDLRTDEDRRRFIEMFWRRRDPTPDTPGNEYRSQFWKRVREANSLHGKDTTKPGWLTDMGKIRILFGPPDEISRDEMAAGRRGIIAWVYRSSPSVGGQSTMTGPNQVITFAQDSSGEYRLTAEPSRLADVWEGLPDPQPAMGQMKHIFARQKAFQEAYARYIGLTDPVIRAAGGPAIQTPLATTMLLARIQQPPEEWALEGVVTTREFFGNLPFRARADFFKSAGDETHVLLNVAVKSRSVTYRSTPSGDRPAVRVYARILDSTATSLLRSLEREGDFAPADENLMAGIDEDLLFQARAALPPGSFVARLTVHDEVSGRTGSSDTPFTVPDFGAAGLEISSVSLARSLRPLDASAGAASDPFVLGGLRVLPHLGQDFLPGEDLAFYYQIYGAARDPATGLPRIDVAYVFLAQEGNQIHEIGRAAFESQTAESHGYALPLKGFPPGGYMVRIEVEDTVAARRASREALFRVLEAP